MKIGDLYKAVEIFNRSAENASWLEVEFNEITAELKGLSPKDMLEQDTKTVQDLGWEFQPGCNGPCECRDTWIYRGETDETL